MPNLKISQLTAGAPAQATDLVPIDRAGANFSLQVSDVLAEGILGGSNVSAVGVVASRVLTAQTAPDGNLTTPLYTVPTSGAGVYRTTGYLVCRTKNTGAWTLNVDVAWPSGTNLGPSAILSATMASPVAPSTGNCATMYLHVGDAITCGTVTGSGSRDTAVFDVAWVVERLV